jgi:Malic enzyme, NAD binding domain
MWRSARRGRNRLFDGSTHLLAARSDISDQGLCLTGVDAIALLARYRNKVSCYNDDIQGTAGVTLAGLINALKITGGKLRDQRILFLGAGSAAIGLADLIVSAVVEKDKIPAEKAREQIRMFDTQGLVVAGRPGLAAHKLPYAHKIPPSKPFNHLDLQSGVPADRGGYRGFQTGGPHWCQYGWQASPPGCRRGYVSVQRATHHFCAV